MRKVLWTSMVICISVASMLLVIRTLRAASAPLAITGVEPGVLRSESGGVLSIYGSDFTTKTLVRLVGFGLLETTYINTQTLKATVPAGVAPGTYDVLVTDVMTSVTLPAALRIVAATPLPTPTSPPPPGRPVLTIRNYAVEPARVSAGREFIVRLEVYNTGSRAAENMMVTFPGGTFLPVGESGHLLGRVHINQTVILTQALRAAAGLSSGIYNLSINLSANDWEGNHYEFPQTIGIEVAGVVQGRPQLLIEHSSTMPAVLRPGDRFDLILTLTNNGNRTATNVLVGVATGQLAAPTEGSNVAPVEAIPINGSATVTVPLVLGEVSRSGWTNLEVTLEYSDWQGGTYSARQSVGLEVSTTLADRPRLLIARYQPEPARLAPGETCTLTLELHNVGGGDALRAVVTFGGTGGEKLAPFAPLFSGNARFVERIAGNATIQVVQPLVVDGSANPGIYSLPIALLYEDERGTRYEDSQMISLIVVRRPRLRIGFYEPVGIAQVGIPFPLPIEVTNIGRSLVNVNTVEATSTQLEITDGVLYLGPLDGGTSGTLLATAVAEVSGTLEVLVTVNYLDDFEQPQVFTKTLSVRVEAPPEPESVPLTEPQRTNAQGGLLDILVRLFRGLLGLGS